MMTKETLLIITSVLQPFGDPPTKKKVVLSVFAVWIIASLLALLPALEQDTNNFHQSAIIKPIMYFKQPDVTFNDLKLLASKFFVYHPELKNITEIQRDEILITNSWSLLSGFLNKTMDGEFTIDGYFGYVFPFNFRRINKVLRACPKNEINDWIQMVGNSK